jgi:hypothetical protein
LGIRGIKGQKFRELMDERLKALYSSHKIFNVTKGNIGWVENLDRMELILYWENPTRRDEGQPR